MPSRLLRVRKVIAPLVSRRATREPAHLHDSGGHHEDDVPRRARARSSSRDDGKRSRADDDLGVGQEWLKTSIAGDRFEVLGGRLALRKSGNREVRILAGRLVKDHSKSLSEGIALAHSIGVTPPSQPEPSMIWELKSVSSFYGSQFDRMYSSLEVYDHVQDIQEAQSEATEGTNPQVRAEARKEIPTLRVHLALARRALSATYGMRG